ncbi:uncharacterized protein AMSG_02632 [Thecamonas trahens ATCC 50062]|uniref:Uncharacterized protein n=1 Tax=Thecamonas trahens ATCC 50062 TaxID=461836 RepID=A0A0L0D8J9_THETB|nr:hypothetical protein AMSG_02632 [Thecamonas trahens ATCC 50062]KNC47608.1 hypothetical protein AMSG_02632 [Thecamonas trahens ATCC 50062]|eukprot:XP_013759533.1 hypothetical protein AMSG_02632 [Thecamonas trahens ATCC 50062]
MLGGREGESLRGRRALATGGAVALAAVAAVVCAGLLNRARGGWYPCSGPTGSRHATTAGGDSQTRTRVVADAHAWWRWLVGAYTGIIGAAAAEPTLSWEAAKKRAIFGLVLGGYTAVALYPDWNTYMGMGSAPVSYSPAVVRHGVFDWLVGYPEPGWSFWARYYRDLVGMSLRGLMMTGPAGLVMYFHGYGWEFLASGVFMGTAYEFAKGSSAGPCAPMAPGPPFGEMLWGCIHVGVLLFATLNFWRRGGARRLDPYLRPGEYWLVCAAGFVLSLVFTISGIWFAAAVPADDREDASGARSTYAGTVFGTLAIAAGSAAGLAAWFLHRAAVCTWVYPNPPTSEQLLRLRADQARVALSPSSINGSALGTTPTAAAAAAALSGHIGVDDSFVRERDLFGSVDISESEYHDDLLHGSPYDSLTSVKSELESPLLVGPYATLISSSTAGTAAVAQTGVNSGGEYRLRAGSLVSRRQADGAGLRLGYAVPTVWDEVGLPDLCRLVGWRYLTVTLRSLIGLNWLYLGVGLAVVLSGSGRS